MSEIATASGYTSPEYARSLAEFGEPLQLPRSGGWLLKRTIPGTDLSDAMGIYPLFCCSDWSQLEHDLQSLDEDIVALSLVVDPFGDWDEALLRRIFPDCAFHYKDHFIVDATLSPKDFVSSRTFRIAKQAQRQLLVEHCENPLMLHDVWCGLYGELVRRHEIQGISAFSRQSFATQLAVPGIKVFRAIHEGDTVAMMLWYPENDVAHCHLNASSDVGYGLHASYALFLTSIQYFATTSVRWLNLGSGAGVGPERGSFNSLAEFKRRWSTGVRPNWFCGRIFDRDKYDALTRERCSATTSYFPEYRWPEVSASEG